MSSKTQNTKKVNCQDCKSNKIIKIIEFDNNGNIKYPFFKCSECGGYKIK